MPRARKPRLTTDTRNANRGTDRGRALLEQSLRELGAGRSILVDKAGRIIAGNKTYETWQEMSNAVEIIKTQGDKLIVVQRDDLDLDEPNGIARRLAYYDNRTGQLDLEWDIEQLMSDLDSGMDLGDLFYDFELDTLIGSLNDEQSEVWDGMPEFVNEDMIHRTIKVHFENDEDVQAFAKLLKQTLTDKTKYVWYPAKKPDDLKKKVYVDES